ncbi:hypothetical protein ACQP1W_01240 [Spirillospora sp. CA-255316]
MERDDGVEHSPTGRPNNDLPDEDPGHLTKDPSKATGPYADADLATRPLPQVAPGTGPQSTDPTPSAQTDELNPPPEATMVPLDDDPQTVQDVTELAHTLTTPGAPVQATPQPVPPDGETPTAEALDAPQPPAGEATTGLTPARETAVTGTTRPLPPSALSDLEESGDTVPADTDSVSPDAPAPLETVAPAGGAPELAEPTGENDAPLPDGDDVAEATPTTPPTPPGDSPGANTDPASSDNPADTADPAHTAPSTWTAVAEEAEATGIDDLDGPADADADATAVDHTPPTTVAGEPGTAGTDTDGLTSREGAVPTTPSTGTEPNVDDPAPLEASAPAGSTPTLAAATDDTLRAGTESASPDDTTPGGEPEAVDNADDAVSTASLEAGTPAKSVPTLGAATGERDTPDADATTVDHTPPETPVAPADATKPLPVVVSGEAEATDTDTGKSDVATADVESAGLDEPASGGEPEAGDAVGTAEPEATAVDDVCAVLAGAYEGLERRLRDGESKAVGWRGQLAALRAMRERRVAGDWDELARLLLRAEPSDVVWDEAVGEVVRRLLAERERVLVLAPTDERAREIVQGLGDEVFALLIDGEEGPVVAGRPLREMGSNGTVEFRPVKPEDLERKAQEPEPEPEQPEVPEFEAVEARLQGVVVRPVGGAWRQAWVTEAKMLQRGLMWLEQWPRDLATLEALQDARERRREELDAELAGLAARIEEMRGAVEEAERAGVQAAEEAERLEGTQARISAELAGPLAEAQRLQADADATADEAGRLTRTAEATRARCEALDQRDAQARTELQAAQQQEEALTADLGRARDDLPRAVEEAERLVAESAAADADGHAKYYRLAAAESALAARRRKLTLGQRLHVAAPPPEIKDLRAEVKALSKEADRAAERAGQAKQAAERAHGYRTQLEAFINEGGARLAQAQEAQRQLGAELARLVPEREAAAADHQEKARLAAEAVQRATQASALAVEAQRVAREIEGRLAAARQAHEAARAAYERAGAEAGAARTGLAEAGALLERRQAEAEEELSTRSAEFEAATEAEARSREKVREICGGDPVDRELLATHQGRAMARIEQLSHYLEHAESGHAASDESAEVLLRTADLVCGTPATVGASGAEFDVLLLAGAGAFNEADFLVGAVRARRWVLLGYDGETPPAYPEYADGGRLSRSPFAASRRP